jgi:hypothetical protein
MFTPIVKALDPCGRELLRHCHGVPGAAEHGVPVDAGRVVIPQLDLDDFGRDQDLALNACLDRLQVEGNLVEPIREVGDLQQARLAVEVELAVRRDQRLHPGLQFLEHVTAIGGRYRRGTAAESALASAHAPGCSAHAAASHTDAASEATAGAEAAATRRARRRAQASASGTPRGHVVDAEDTCLPFLPVHPEDVVLQSVLEAQRHQDQLQCLSHRDVLQFTGEGAVHVGIRHHAQVCVSHEQQQQLPHRNRR